MSRRVSSPTRADRADRGDRSLEQLQNVATLPGISGAVLAMPDIHQGYGFPVGGVAATEPPDGVVSPGGVGYDINCGVRLLALPLSAAELGARREALVHEISRRVPVGAGHGGALRLAVRHSIACSSRAAAPAGGARHRHRRGRRAHRIARVPGRRGSGRGLRACPRARRRPARDARVRQPLPRAAARRRRSSIPPWPRRSGCVTTR